MWWKNAIFYEIYLASFKDSNGDGVGDIQGIIQKLPDLKKLGITGIWLTPFYPSPKVDNGYDISNYCAVSPEYGSLSDFDELMSKAHELEIRVIADLVINHTSTAHPWFHDERKRDWYIWREQPNNWESFFGGSAWEFDEKVGKFYYHSFAKEQADLNWSNPAVKRAIFQVMDFWNSRGIDGFRLDVINNLSTSSNLQDNPLDEKGQQIHLYDVNQAGILETIKELRNHLSASGKELFTVGEISSNKLEVIEKYAGLDLLDVTFNFNFGSQEKFDLPKIVAELEEMQNALQNDRMPTLFFNSHGMARSWGRLANEKLDLYLQLATLLIINRGVTFLYQGEELGLGDFNPQSVNEIRDTKHSPNIRRLKV